MSNTSPVVGSATIGPVTDTPSFACVPCAVKMTANGSQPRPSTAIVPSMVVSVS
jgi:hypothetical protein